LSALSQIVITEYDCASFCRMWQGYTNADNPFGDEHLLDTFVWQKKLEKEGQSDLAQAELEKIQKSKMVESKVVQCTSLSSVLSLT